MRYDALCYVTTIELKIVVIVCLFVWGFSSHSRIFHSFGDVTNTGEGLLFYLYWAFLLTYIGTHSHWAVRVLWRATPTVTRAKPLKWSSSRTRETHTRCQAFGSRAVTTCLKDLGLPRLGIEPHYHAGWTLYHYMYTTAAVSC